MFVKNVPKDDVFNLLLDDYIVYGFKPNNASLYNLRNSKICDIDEFLKKDIVCFIVLESEEMKNGN